MTATVREFCRINGIDEKTTDLAEIIYSALVGGDKDRIIRKNIGERAEVETPIPDGD